MKNKIIECLKTLHEVIELDKMKEFLENIQEIIGLKLLQMGQEITSYPHSEDKWLEINKEIDILIAEINFFGYGINVLKVKDDDSFKNFDKKYFEMISRLRDLKHLLYTTIENNQ